jgi:hypothetical protein
MKRCTYCGKEYDDEATVCAIDAQPLVQMSAPAPQTATTQSPALWNPNAAACWSLIFSPAFGACLHARNAEALGRADEARANRVWFYISICFLALACITTLIPAIPDAWFQTGGVALLLGWYFSLGKKQIAYVKVTWRDDYEHKPWRRPLLIGVGCFAGAFALIFVLAMVQELVFGSQ